MTPRLRCSRPWEEALTNVEAKEGSSPSTTALPGTPTLLGGPGSDSSPKWDTTSDTVRAVSGSREMGGISNSSSPRLGVWNVCRAQRAEKTGGGREANGRSQGGTEREMIERGKNEFLLKKQNKKKTKLRGKMFLHHGVLSFHVIALLHCDLTVRHFQSSHFDTDMQL